jgi:tRNA(Ile)-lysidine synthase
MVVEQVRDFLDRHHIAPSSILVACSGGIDSTALLVVLAEMGGVVCGHVNHHLRGAESDADEQFVRDLAARLNVAVDVADGTLDPAAVAAKGVEGAAREVREVRLRQLAGTRLIATAHQMNDQAETVLMRLMTGSGFGGLRSIHPVREDGFIRPLLGVSRADIEQFLVSRQIVARVDSSNADRRFLRNRIRAVLAGFDSAAIDNLAEIASQAQQVWPLVERGLDGLERECAKVMANETRFLRWPDDAWSRQALLLRHIRRLGDAREISSSDLERLAASPDTIRRLSVTRELELIRRRGTLVLRRKPAEAVEYELLIRPDQRVSVPGHSVVVRSADWRDPRSSDRTRQLIQLPDGTSSEFVLRNRRRGDRFHPLGAAGHKKLKDFLIDRKIPTELRDRAPLLIWNGEIVLVAGVEVSERFKVTSPAGVLFEVVVEDESHEPDQRDIQR